MSDIMFAILCIAITLSLPSLVMKQLNLSNKAHKISVCIVVGLVITMIIFVIQDTAVMIAVAVLTSHFIGGSRGGDVDALPSSWKSTV